MAILALDRPYRKRRSISPKLRMQVFIRDNFCCRYCGRSQGDGAVLEVDHVVSVAQGGSNEIENLFTACFDCNRGKSDMQWTDDYRLIDNPKRTERPKRFQSYRVCRYDDSCEKVYEVKDVRILTSHELLCVWSDVLGKMNRLRTEAEWLHERFKVVQKWENEIEERRGQEAVPHPPDCQCPLCRPAA